MSVMIFLSLYHFGVPAEKPATHSSGTLCSDLGREIIG